MRPTDPQIATLAATVRSLRETRARLELVETPNAWDLVEAELAANEKALSLALAYPLTSDSRYWRKAPLTGGRLAEVFNIGAGVTVAIRRANGTTERCTTKQNEMQALALFRDIVLDDTKR